MASFPFGRLQETEIRKPSRVLLVFFILFLLLLILSVTFIALYVVEKTKSTDSSSGTCNTPVCITTAADILKKLDQSANPCDDFYQYSCGGFIKKTHLEDSQGLVGSFSLARDVVQYSLRDILQNEKLMSNYSKDSAVYKTFTYYKSCVNETSIENVGIKPLLDIIEQHGSWNITNKNWTGDSWVLERILARVFVDLQTSAFLGLDVSSSFFNTSEMFITIYGGISGYERNPLDNEQFRSIIAQQPLENENVDNFKSYRVLMSTIFKLLGSNSSIEEEVNRIVDLEREFSKIKKKFDGTKPKQFKKNVKFMTLGELNSLTSFKFNWTMYFEEILLGTNIKIPSNLKLMILLPDNIKKIVDWIADKPKSLLANEIIWNVVRGFTNTLPLVFRNAQKIYSRIFSPRWKICNTLTDDYFQYATTLLYVTEHLPEDARETAAEMFEEIRKQFINGLKEQSWMDSETRDQARLKLQKMTDVIGFPSFIKDPVQLNSFYKNVKVDQYHMVQNTLNIYRDQIQKKISIFGLSIDSSRSSLGYLAINAFYDPSANRMTILAGILQPPFYKSGAIKALNYGALGMVVGHEITHGFDNTGSEYDENGNVRDWWTKKSRENFIKRSTCLVQQYNKVEIFGYKVNGSKTLPENIADNGGLKYAFRAYQHWRSTHGNEDKLPGLSFNNDQLFFIGFAQEWCGKYKKEFAKRLMDSTDPHSLQPVRVRVPVSNFPEFSKTFGCTPPNHTCTVW